MLRELREFLTIRATGNNMKKEKRYAHLNVQKEQKSLRDNNEKHLTAQFKLIVAAFGKAIALEITALSTFTADAFYASETRISEVVKMLLGDSRVDKALLAPISKLLTAGIRRSEDFTEAVSIFGSIRAASNHAYEVGAVFSLLAKLRKVDLITPETANEQRAEVRKAFRLQTDTSVIVNTLMGAIAVTPENVETSIETLSKFLKARTFAKSQELVFNSSLEIADGKIRYAALATAATA